MSEYHTAVALIVVTDTEETAVKHMYNWMPHTFEGDAQPYYEACFTRNGKEYRVVYARQNEMGMVAAAVLASKIISHYLPHYLIMVGLAAGIARSDVAEQIYGDVNVADLVWNYAAGKFVPTDRADIHYGNVGFIPRPTMIRMREEVRPFVEAAAASPENQCHVHIGLRCCRCCQQRGAGKAGAFADAMHGGTGYGVLRHRLRRRKCHHAPACSADNQKRLRLCRCAEIRSISKVCCLHKL